jgi:DNA-binding CsgD family transcriptional regulator
MPTVEVVLTDTERQVVEMLDRGLTIAEIADALDSRARARVTLERLRAKLGDVKKRQIVQRCRELGLYP